MSNAKKLGLFIAAVALFIVSCFADSIADAAAHNGWLSAAIIIVFILEMIVIVSILIKGRK